MKLKKLIATAMSFLCLSSANILAEAENIKTDEEVYVVDSGIVSPALGNIDIGVPIIVYPDVMCPEVQWEALSNGVLRVFSTDENYNAIPNCCVVELMGGGCFEHYRPLGACWPDSCEKLVIDDSIKTIGMGAFYKTSFEEVEIYCNGEGTLVDKYAFNLTNIDNLTVYGDQITFGQDSFLQSGIQELDLSNCNKVSFNNNSFENCNNLTKVNSSKEKLYINNDVFYNCSQLNEFDSFTSITHLGTRAFCDCGLLPSKIIFSEETSKIGSLAFKGTNVTDIVLLNSKTQIHDWYAFNQNSTIYGYKGSTAEEYVESHADDNCTFVSLDDIKGDVQTDAEVNTSDVVLLQKYLVKKETLNEHQLAVADVNNDGLINVFDLMLLKRNL